MADENSKSNLDLNRSLEKAADAARILEVNRAFKVLDIRECKISWEETKNPLFVWRAYQVSREIEYDLPTWVLEYFDKSANHLLNPKFKYEGNEIPKEFYDAMGMHTTGQGVTPWKAYEKFSLRLNAVFRVEELKNINPKMSYEKIYADVEKELSAKGEDVKARTIESWRTKMKEILDRPLT